MDRLKRIIDRCKGSFELSVNDHKDVYLTVEDFCDGVEINKEVLVEMIKRDKVINMHFYPDTPIGFYSVYHYDLDMCLDEAIKILEQC